MTDWTAGYVADIGYTDGYYTELNLTRLALPFLNAGLAVPEISHACELGFGQGLSINLHAAAQAVSWHGTDFNPSQAAFAQALAEAAGSDAQLFDQSHPRPTEPAQPAPRSWLPPIGARLHGQPAVP